MKPNTRSVVMALSLGIGLVLAIGFRVQEERARSQQRHDLWLAYVRGPLTLYVQGSREGAQALLARPSKTRRRNLGDAEQDLRQAWVLDGDMEPVLEADETFDPLTQGVQWFNSAQELAEAWHTLETRRPDQISAASTAAEGIRSQLSLLVSQEWIRLSQDRSLSWTAAERVQSQVLVQALAQPLPLDKGKVRFRKRTKKRLIHNKKGRLHP
ncbi:MAG: hypothetical protein ACREKE_04960 [bacterium]